jgi:hypothetical protein
VSYFLILCLTFRYSKLFCRVLLLSWL